VPSGFISDTTATSLSTLVPSTNQTLCLVQTVTTLLNPTLPCRIQPSLPVPQRYLFQPVVRWPLVAHSLCSVISFKLFITSFTFTLLWKKRQKKLFLSIYMLVWPMLYLIKMYEIIWGTGSVVPDSKGREVCCSLRFYKSLLALSVSRFKKKRDISMITYYFHSQTDTN
jgi:hypothetical protein